MITGYINRLDAVVPPNPVMNMDDVIACLQFLVTLDPFSVRQLRRLLPATRRLLEDFFFRDDDEARIRHLESTMDSANQNRGLTTSDAFFCYDRRFDPIVG